MKDEKMEKLSTESYKGVRDFYPEDQQYLNYLFTTCRTVAEKFGYAEYGASILEPSELYKAKGAENTDMVNEETYTFVDRGGREVTLRPEMTPTVARMVAARRRDFGFPLRLFSIPNLFRYERPQRGRVREHWQLNVDIFGSDSLAADAEVIQVAHDILIRFGGTEKDFIIKLGSRAYIDALAQELQMSEEATKTLLGLLDRKNKMSEDEFNAGLAQLGVPTEKLSANNPPADVQEVLTILGTQGVTNAVFDPSIVRGFNYYTGVVFEVYDTHKDNNRALFGGGRYDNLLKLFDDAPVVGVGFGMGDTMVYHFLEVRGLLPTYTSPAQAYLAVEGATPEMISGVQALAKQLRDAELNIAVDFGEKKLVDQFKNAEKNKIPYAIKVGADSLAEKKFFVRNLETQTDEANPMSVDELVAFFNSR